MFEVQPKLKCLIVDIKINTRNRLIKINYKLGMSVIGNFPTKQGLISLVTTFENNLLLRGFAFKNCLPNAD